MSFDAAATAAAILDTRRAGRLLSAPASGAPANEEEGAAAQLALARLMGADPPTGFKIGVTGRRMQALLGLPGPAAGFMHGPLHESGARLDFAGLRRPGLECEIVLRLGRDLPPGACPPGQARAAIGAMMAGIEIVENRYEDFTRIGYPMLIADQVFHAGAVIGAEGADPAGLDLRALRGRIHINGALADEGLGAELLGDPINCLAWLAASPVAAAFGGLRAGQTIMLGSVTPVIWLDGPAEAVVSFPPLPEVRVTLA
ncbi:MAG TPA: fumarylacetoacetate hydrolase family protein [Acetobacteraceae bacterium]|nr:fumarylacetoacetate hydrolase family protein [Acetobacteraceae bacterium]